MRYIVTRPCLAEGTVRLLKYLEVVFPQDGPIILIDDQGSEHHARVDHRAGRVFGLGSLYTSHNLGVNDVLHLLPLSEGRYQVECIIKPIANSAAPARPRLNDVPQRVVLAESPYVREVRLERPSAAKPAEKKSADAQPAPRSTEAAPPAAEATPPAPAPKTVAAPVPTAPTNAPTPASPAPAQGTSKRALSPEELVRELAALVGYAVEVRAPGVVLLRADLGPQRYSVAVAMSPQAGAAPNWREGADYAAVVVAEQERVPGAARLTVEAMRALLDHARLAPLTPLELRGYWNAGGFDLDSVASVAELVSAQLSAKGVFSFVVMTLAQQPAHSVVSASRLAERLGSGANTAELARVLDTLVAAPFGALSPLGGGQYYLRTEIGDVLRGLGEYADGLRARLDQARLEQSARSGQALKNR